MNNLDFQLEINRLMKIAEVNTLRLFFVKREAVLDNFLSFILIFKL